MAAPLVRVFALASLHPIRALEFAAMLSLGACQSMLDDRQLVPAEREEATPTSSPGADPAASSELPGSTDQLAGDTPDKTDVPPAPDTPDASLTPVGTGSPAGPEAPTAGGTIASPPSLPLPGASPPTFGSVRELATGIDHSCALLDSGSVRCWGGSRDGVLGYGNTGPRDPDFVVETIVDIGDDELPASAGLVDIGGEARALFAASRTTCAVLADGLVRCWGRLPFLQDPALIVGDDEPPAVLGSVDFGGPVRQLAIGKNHVCALAETGNVRCFAPSPNGNGDSLSGAAPPLRPASPWDVAVGGPVRQIATDSSNACALLETGAVRCWRSDGSSDDDDSSADVDDSSADIDGGARDGVFDVALGEPARQIAGAGCAVLETGAVRCWDRQIADGWGYGDNARFGDEISESAREVPIGGRVAQLGIGSRHACALLETGALRCWGANELGQLGYGHTNTIGDDETPESAGDVPIGGRAVRLSVGGDHTCVLLEGAGVRCFGAGYGGQLGYGNSNHIGDDETPDRAGFVDVAADPAPRGAKARAVVQLATGGDHNCALLDTGWVRCWGAGYRGQLGNEDRQNVGDDELPASRAPISLRGTVRQLATGGQHSCALLDSGALRCWGAAENGQLGYANPRSVGDDEKADSAGFVDTGGNVRQVVLGRAHTCALLESDAVRCWGTSGLATLDGTVIVGDDEVPATQPAIELGGPVRELSAGAFYTCALRLDGEVRCWGLDGYTLDYPNPRTAADAGAPTPPPALAFGTPARQIAAGRNVLYAVLDSGEIWYVANVDPLTRIAPTAPVRMELGEPAIRVVAGDEHACAHLASGSVSCWGHYLAPPDYSLDLPPPPPGPQRVAIGGRVARLAAGAGHTCALLESGTVRCWGQGGLGQLGLGNVETIGDDETVEAMGDVPLF